MAKYDPLTVFLRKQAHREVPMRFAELERVLGNKLPRSAYEHRAWWANESNGHVHAKAWLDAGFQTAQVDMAGKKLVFCRMRGARTEQPRQMEEARRMYKHENGVELKDGRHPALGSMTGLLTVMPGTDLTAPAIAPDEWDKILKEMEAKWDRLLGPK